jgi:stringent starvation protein B
MQIFNFTFLPVFCMSLFVPAALAENLAVPAKDHRQGMSYEEYSSYREKMIKRMDESKQSPEERRQLPDSSRRPHEQMEKPNPNSAYGQGYQSRKLAEDRAERGVDNRPERPSFERFNRGDTGRR